MIDQAVKRLVIMVFILALLFTPMAKADSRKVSEDEIKLTETIKAFFTHWLIKRDVQRAMRYVSSRAIFSKTALPNEFKSKDKLSQKDISKIFGQTFSQTLKYSQSSDKLGTSISSSYGFMAKNDSVISIEHLERKLFELFVLNIKEGDTAQNFAFICKFDETPTFREAVGKPTCYYVMTDVRFSSSVATEAQVDKFPFEMVWIKENNDWRILTIGTIED